LNYNTGIWPTEGF